MAIKDDSINIRLGSGLSFPIEGSFEVISGIPLLIQEMEQLLLTIPGERVGRPDFGCHLRDQIWENIYQAAEDGASSIETALNKFEPRITDAEVDYDVNENSGLITFSIHFLIINTDNAVNLVFPFRSGTALSFA